MFIFPLSLIWADPVVQKLGAVREESCVVLTYQRRCEQELILYLSRRTLGTGLQSLCKEYTFESRSSRFCVLSGSRLSSPHIHLEDTTWVTRMGKDFKRWGSKSAKKRPHLWLTEWFHWKRSGQWDHTEPGWRTREEPPLSAEGLWSMCRSSQISDKHLWAASQIPRDHLLSNHGVVL